MNHTPGKWKIGKSHTGEIAIRDTEGECIAVCCDLISGEMKANAEFIVKACNSYDDMLEALKYAEREIKFLTEGSDWEDIVNPITKAINKAEGL